MTLPTELVVDTIMRMPDGRYHARVLEDDKWVWRDVPDELAERIQRDVREAVDHLLEMGVGG